MLRLQERRHVRPLSPFIGTAEDHLSDPLLGANIDRFQVFGQRRALLGGAGEADDPVLESAGIVKFDSGRLHDTCPIISSSYFGR